MITMRARLAAVALIASVLALFAVHQPRAQLIGDGVWKSASGCNMAFDAVSTATLAGGASSLSWTHTPVGTPTAVSVGFQLFLPLNSTSTTVTYNGLSMTRAATVIDGIGSLVDIFGLANPPAGPQTVTIADPNNNLFIEAGAVTVTCSSILTAFENANSATGTSAAPSVAVTSVAGEIVVDFLGGYNGGSPYATTGTGQVQNIGPLSSGGNRGFGSILTATGASSTMSWSSTSTVYGIVAASFKHK